MKFFILSFLLVSFANIIKSQPVITSFSPTAAPAGSQIVINGAGFSNTSANNIVYFGAVKAVVSSSIINAITVIVPVGATYNPLSVTTGNLTAISSNCFIPTFSGGDSNFTYATLPSRKDIPTGFYPHKIGTADFDGDGKTDVAVIRGSSNTITIFRNSSSIGDITFNNGIEIPATATSQESCAIADFDGDGKPDMAVVNSYIPYTLSIYRNLSTPGIISFDIKKEYPAINGPYNVAAGDLNGDGKPEIVLANNGSDKISIYRNLCSPGLISFGDKIDLSTGTNPYGITITDFDGDGLADIGLTHQGSTSSISVIRNVSSGANFYFDSIQHFDYLAGPFDVSFGDLDGDDKPDIIAAISNSNILAVYKNISTTGSINFDIRKNLATGNYPTGITITDLNGDGKPDVLCTNRHDHNISAFKNKSTVGNLDFDTQINYSVGLYPYGITSADLNGDSIPEILVANTSDGFITILAKGLATDFNPSIGSFTPNTGTTGSIITIQGLNFVDVSSVKFGGVPAASFTVDSSKGITAVVANGASGVVTVTTPNGTAILNGFEYKLPNPLNPPVINSFTPEKGAVGSTVKISGSNFNTTPSNNIVYFGSVRAVVTSSSPEQLEVIVPPGSTHQFITVTVNNLTAYSSKIFKVLFLSANSSFTASSFIKQGEFPAGVYPTDVAIADIDNDGKPDMLSVNANTNSVSVFKNTSSNGNLSMQSKIDYPVGQNPRRVAIADLDGDGFTDFVVTDFNSGNTSTITILRNTSTPGNISLSPIGSIPTGLGSFGIAINDLNEDGKPDIIVSSSNSGYFSIFKNISSGTGNISFSPKTDYIFYNRPDYISTADLDEDGKPEIITSNFTSSSITVFSNNSSGGSIAFSGGTQYATGQYPLNTAIGDLNDDGNLDIAGINYGAGTLSLLKNFSSTGNIALNDLQNFNIASSPRNVTIADLDGDGKNEFITTSSVDGTVSVFRNSNSIPGAFSFEPAVTYTAGTYDEFVNVADMDGDNKPDLVIANSIDNNVVILSNKVEGPTISNLSVTAANAGMALNITGKNFTGATDLKFGGVAASSFTINNNSTQISATVGGGASGDITVTTPAGTGIYGGFKFIPTISYSGNTSLCQGNTLPLTSSANSNNQWYKNGQPIPGANAKTYNAGESGTYHVSTTSNNIITTSNNTVNINVTAIPNPSISKDDNNNLVSSASLGNQWYVEGLPIVGATSQVYHPVQTGNYSVRVSVNNCLSDFAVNFYFLTTGVRNLGDNQYIKIYPNPVTGQLLIESKLNRPTELNYVLINIDGKQVATGRKFDSNTFVNVNSLPSGEYFIRIYSIDLKINYTTKIIKLK